MFGKIIEWFASPIVDIHNEKKEQEALKQFENNIDTNINTEQEPKKEPKTVSNLNPPKRKFTPTSFDQYIGQEKAKRLLQAYISGIKKRNLVFPHTLIYGPAGCGKTTLAKIIAIKMGVNFKEMISTSFAEEDDLVYVAKDLEGGILFIDEIHRLGRNYVEPLYPVMESFTHEGEEINPFTIIGATTEIGEIIKSRRPFYDRFIIKQELEHYEQVHMVKIIEQYKNKTFPDEQVEQEALNVISRNCRLVPRRAISLLQATIYLESITDVLDSFNIIAKGYTHKDLKALKFIARHEKGVGQQAIMAYMQTSKENYLYDMENYYLQNDLINRTARGRKITERGLELIEYLDKKKGG